jgi:gamma-glutamyltranspeptidase/glutathione hydrolase
MNIRGSLAALGMTLIAQALFAGSEIVAKKAALATTSPVATQVGLRVLQGGGNAADAAVAIALALGVVQPHAAGLGGGGFLVYWDAKTKGVWALDFREAAPLAIKPDTFKSRSARLGPIGAGVPGTVAGMAALHERFGTQPWKTLVAPAAALAREGVRVDADVAAAIAAAMEERHIEQFKSTAPLLQKKLGETLVQPELAATLERLGERGARDFYDGELARKLVDAVRAGGGILTDRDLHDYAAAWRAPIRISFRKHDICMPPPPSTGAFVIAEAMNILGGYALDPSAKTFHYLAEAERRATHDRDRYLGDPDQARIPWRELLSDERAKLWRATIDPNRVTPNVMLAEPATPAESPHTAHFSIYDANGNAASVTLTLDDDFGGGYVVPGLGFVLNDAMHDFTSSTANAIGPSRRPASSLSPAIVLRDGVPLLIEGTSGGATIPTTMLQIILRSIVFTQPLADAIAAPRFHQDASVEDMLYERDRAPRQVLEALKAMGHGVRAVESIGNVSAVGVYGERIFAVADPRHGGAAGGY